MRKVREVLRLKHECGLSERQIESAVGVGHGTVGSYIRRAADAGLSWEVASTLSDAEVEARLFQQVGRNEPPARAPIDLAWVHTELRRAGVTLELLWSEYQQAVADGGTGRRAYQYSQFCALYRAYQKKLSPAMRQTHRAGEKMFLDFSGQKPRLINAMTGESIEVELFVMVAGASNYTYAEATWTQGLDDFVGATVHGLEYFGGVSEMLVPDQLRSAVKTPDRYEPEINATYAELAQHYGTAIVPARPRKPRDKAKVEGGVLIAQRWILASLRNRRFFSLEELNAAIRELLEKLNTRPFKKLEGCRRSVFEKLERPALRPLPARRYEVGAWKLGVGVNVDHHVAYENRFYSVPSELIGEKVDLRASTTVIEVWRDNRRITSHERSYGPKGTAVTKEEHRPRAHREWGAWPSERLMSWAQTKGPRTGAVAAAILARGPHPESGRRACLGLVRLGEQHGSERLEQACGRALAIGSPTYKSVKAILKSGLEKARLVEEVEPPRVTHENIRGGDYFDRKEESPTARNEEIEARYLDEERYSIMNEPSVAPRQQAPRSSRVETQWEASGRGAASAPHVVVTEPLPALLARLQGTWMNPRPVVRIGRQKTDDRGGDDSRHVECADSAGASQCECLDGREGGRIEAVPGQRYPMYEENTCQSEEEGMAWQKHHRGEA